MLRKAYGFIMWFFSKNASAATMTYGYSQPGSTYLMFGMPSLFSDKTFDKDKLRNTPPSDILPLQPMSIKINL